MSVLGQRMSLGLGLHLVVSLLPQALTVKTALGDCKCVHVPPNGSERCGQVVPGRFCHSKLYPL